MPLSPIPRATPPTPTKVELRSRTEVKVIEIALTSAGLLESRIFKNIQQYDT